MERRKFLFSSALIAGMPAVTLPGLAHPAENPVKQTGNKNHKIRLGVIADGNNPPEDLKIVRDLGFPTCQLNVATYSPQLATKLSDTLANYHIEPTTLLCMGPGPYKWNFIDGPSTIGLVPREYRTERVKRLMQGMDFCKAAGIPTVHAHFGFIPENPKDVLYLEFVETMKPVGEYALKQGLDIFFETGQETPITLLRAIRDIGTGNLFVNYDTANLVMYGKSNPLDGLKVIGKYVRALHAKDGMYPVDPDRLGDEVPIPTGEVNFPAVIAALKTLGFEGAITIECELDGQNSDYIVKTRDYLQKLIDA